jgi:hypothetical protein
MQMHCAQGHKAILLFILVLLSIELTGQNKTNESYRAVFYNTENLFDTRNDPATNDEEFTPSGKCHWSVARLNQKVMMVYRALISASEGHFPDIIGLAEIENLWVVEYLISHTPLKEANYGIIHKESPDPRGIDVALLYRKETVTPIDFDFIPVSSQGAKKFISRDILCFKAKLGKEYISFFVNHWPSRSGGYTESVWKRNSAASILRKKLDSLLIKSPQGKFLLMGDFNATPDEECFTRILRTNSPKDGDNPEKLVNLSIPWTKSRIGTIRTKGQWEIFDQFICSFSLFSGKGLQITSTGAKICSEKFLLEDDNRYLGKKPFRTYLGPVYHGGISDHLPISVAIQQRSP